MINRKEIERSVQLPHRAPMIIVAIAKYIEHEKVPKVEQIASASCAVMAMQMAAVAQDSMACGAVVVTPTVS